ncbi:helix-turn-helix transcriptional regulator [Conyzicola nivalis]|uniref:helix-turn-helix transcriptional regulator n=1 Tax=Conyzicola nivalis TaxID=1477021 RepID=UPI00339A8722
MPGRIPRSTSIDQPLAQVAGLPSLAAAAYIGVAQQTLANWRVRGEGPPYAKLGRSRTRIVYRIADLDRYLADHMVGAAR